MINGSYQAAVALGSWLCFPPITLAGRKMGHRENGWNSMGQTFVLDLEGRLIKTPEAGVDEV